MKQEAEAQPFLRADVQTCRSAFVTSRPSPAEVETASRA